MKNGAATPDIADYKNKPMSYTENERKQIAQQIREYLKEETKEKFEEATFGREKILVKRTVTMTWHDRDVLENVARDVEGRILHP